MVVCWVAAARQPGAGAPRAATPTRGVDSERSLRRGRCLVGGAVVAVLWTCDVCVVLNVSSAFHHPTRSPHLARHKPHNTRIHEKQSPVAFLISIIIASDTSAVFRSQSLP